MAETDYSHLVIDGKPSGMEPDSAYLSIPVPTGHRDSIDRPWRGVVTRDGWRYICLKGQPWTMFYLNDDPYELVNLAHNTWFWDERRHLHDHLQTWITNTGASFSLPQI